LIATLSANARFFHERAADPGALCWRNEPVFNCRETTVRKPAGAISWKADQ
jgi:hypothetical protein